MAKFCMHCGSKLKDEDRFCMHCGTKCPGDTNSREKSTASFQQEQAIFQTELEMAKRILLSSKTIPDYAQALVHLVQAKKLGAHAEDIDTLMLIDQLYRTLDMLRKTYVDSNTYAASHMPQHPTAKPAPHTLLEHPSSNSGNQQSSSHGTTNNHMGTYMKAAAIGAVAGAAANSLLRRHDVQVTDDMLNLMHNQYGIPEPDAAAMPDDMSSTDNATSDNTDDVYESDSENMSDHEDTDTTYSDDDWTNTEADASDTWNMDDAADDMSESDSSYDADDGSDDFF